MTETNLTTASSMRLGLCEVCAAQEARYACPKCEVKTCCLSCVQIHKRELNCDGIRDRTKYVPLTDMTAREFMSDYCFLEECTRYTENRKQDPSKRFTHQQRNLPVPQHRLRLAAQKRGTHLQLLLPNFSRHKKNSTFLDWKLGRLYWRIEWLFMGEGDPVKFEDPRCDEDLTLAALLNKYVDVQQQETAREQRKRLALHQKAGIGQLSLWLRAEGVRRSAARCHPLSLAKTLRQNLKGKTIVEFPTIFVSYQPHPPQGWAIVDSDEEFDKEPELSPAAEPAKKLKLKEESDDSEPHDVYHLMAAQHVDEDDDDDSEPDSETDNRLNVNGEILG